MSYPFSYFSALFSFKRALAQRQTLSWFQMGFTFLFLLSLSLTPIALQAVTRTSYPMENLIEHVYDPLTDDVLQQLDEHAQLIDERLTYTGEVDIFSSEAGVVRFGETELGNELTLNFQSDQLIISKAKKELARMSYEGIRTTDFASKDSLTKALSSSWYQQNQLAINLFLVLVATGILGLNSLILLVGASCFLYLTKRSRLFVFRAFKECLNFTLNCWGLPVLIGFLSGLLGNDLATMVTVQNSAFVLFLALVFYRTHFQDFPKEN